MEKVGATELISIGKYHDVPAKIDTGADASAIWASNIRIDRNGVLKFSLFGEGHPQYTGRVIWRTDFGVARVKSSNGSTQLRYRTHLTIKIAGKTIRALFYLSDRSRHAFPVLIGRRTIANKFVVDVSKRTIKLQKPKKAGLNAALRMDPHAFHKKYMKGERS